MNEPGSDDDVAPLLERRSELLQELERLNEEIDLRRGIHSEFASGISLDLHVLCMLLESAGIARVQARPLNRANIYTIGQLVACSEKYLLGRDVPDFGPKGLAAVNEVLYAYGLYVGGEVAERLLGLRMNDPAVGDLDPRLDSGLKDAQLHTLGDLMKVTAGELRELARFKSDIPVKGVRRVLGRFGLALRDEVPHTK